MKHCIVDKRVAGIIRWLERMKKSYSDGAIESALMDAECARADLENLRNDVWQKAIKPVRNEHKFAFSMLRIFSLAVIVILFHVVPLAKDIVPVQSVSEEMNALINKPKPIIVIRVDEEEKPKEEKSEPRVASSKKTPRKQIVQKKIEKPAVNSQNVNQESQKTVPYDKVLSLVQTGQRALKENTSVIKIQK